MLKKLIAVLLFASFIVTLILPMRVEADNDNRINYNLYAMEFSLPDTYTTTVPQRE